MLRIGTDSADGYEFLYVTEATRAIELAVEKYNKPEPVNIGSGEDWRITSLAQAIRARVYGLTGKRIEVQWDDSKPDGQPRRQVDTSKAFAEFGFVNSILLKAGLAKTIKWYRESLLANA